MFPVPSAERVFAVTIIKVAEERTFTERGGARLKRKRVRVERFFVAATGARACGAEEITKRVGAEALVFGARRRRGPVRREGWIAAAATGGRRNAAAARR